MCVVCTHVTFAQRAAELYQAGLGGLSQLGLERARIAYVALEGFPTELLIIPDVIEAALVHVQDVTRDVVVGDFVALVEDDEEQVEARHDWRRNVHVALERLAAVVPVCARVCLSA